MQLSMSKTKEGFIVGRERRIPTPRAAERGEGRF
jgi:hypothetical protein